MRQPRPIGQNVLVLFVGSTIGSLALAIRGLILARVVGPEPYGDFLLALTFAGTFTYGFVLGMDVIIPRELARDPTLLGVLFPSAILPTMAWAVILILGINVAGYVSGYSSNVRALLVITTPIVAFQGLSALMGSMYRGVDRMEVDAFFGAFQGVLGLALGGGVAILTGSIFSSAVASLAAGGLTFFVSLCVASRLPATRRSFDLRFFWRIILAASPLVIMVIIAQLGQNIAMLILGRLSSARDVGLFGASLAVVTFMRPLHLAYASAFLPRLSMEALATTEAPPESHEKGFRFALIMGVALGVTTTMIAPMLIRVFYGSQFSEASQPLRILGFAAILLFLNVYLWQVYIAQGKQIVVLIISFIGLLISSVLSLLLIPLLGIAGAAVAFSTRELIQTLLLTALLQRRWGSVGLRGQSFLSVLIAAVALVACLWMVRFSVSISALVLVAVGMIVYALVLPMTGGVAIEELRALVPSSILRIIEGRNARS